MNPIKVISGLITSELPLDLWPFEEGVNDPWWTGGSNPRPYRWRLTININEQPHSGFDSRIPFLFDGEDVRVGDWVAGTTLGRTYKIISVESKSSVNVTITIEDVARYNTIKDSSTLGNGAIEDTNIIIFSVGPEGMPLIDPAPVSLSNRFFTNVQSYFQLFNDQFEFNLVEPDNNFQKGDIIAVDSISNKYVLANSTFTSVIGKVSRPGPGPNNFFINPAQKIIDNLNSMPGNIGDKLYVDAVNPGQITTDSSSGKVVYIKLRNESSTTTRGTVENPSVTFGNVLSINGVNVTFTGSSLGSVVDDINAAVAPDVVAASALATNTIQTSLSLNYGVVALFTDGSGPAEATINGVTVVFDVNVDGQQQFGVPACSAADMVTVITRDMAAANNTDIVAERISNTVLRLTNLSGGAINIVNTVLDKNSIGFAGAGSGSGLELTTAASTEEVLTLTAADARAINLRNVTGTPLQDLGIWSVENGVKAAALYVEQGLRSGSVTVVADIAGRDGLTALVGDQAYVLDRGNGEWALFLWDGGQWVQVADEDSARTDADSLSFELTPATGTSETIGTVSNNSRVTLITVTVTTVFDGTPTLTIGDDGDNDRLMGDDQIDLTQLGTYTTQSNHLYAPGPNIDTDIKAYFDAGGATVGSATIVVTYV